MKIEPSFTNINAFLHYGWLPRLDKEPSIPHDWVSKEVTIENPKTTDGAQILKEAFVESLDNSSEIVVPLSGGLDSRTMLAIADELGYKTKTITLGVPGTNDFEIGRIVAASTNSQHEQINLNALPLETANLVQLAKETGDWTNILEVSFNLHINKKYEGLPVVSGFLGDFTGGSYTFLNRWNWNETRNHFSAHNNVSRDIKITSSEYDPIASLPKLQTYSQNTTLGEYEELVLRTRHTCSLRPTVFDSDLNYKIPFRNKKWVYYMTSIPTTERLQQKFYRNMLAAEWPKFFNLPTATFHGLPLQHSHFARKKMRYRVRFNHKFRRALPTVAEKLFGINPTTNYTDFHNQLVINQNLRNVVQENISDLHKRNCTPWLDLKDVLSRYFDSRTRILPHEATMLIVLTNLEINLKASDSYEK